MKNGSKAPKSSKLVTGIFYTGYFLLIIGYLAGMYVLRNWMTDQLVEFEAATQPSVRAEQIFQQRFANPDWNQLYEDAGLADTEFENKETVLAYIASMVGDQVLTYAEIPDASGNPTFLVQVTDQPLCDFTLVNRANENALIPDWQLGDIRFHLPRNYSVTVEKLDGHTVYINGKPLDDSYTLAILSSTAEDYLPEGTLGIRKLRQKVTGLLMMPEVTILDGDGNHYDLIYDEERDIYTEVLPVADFITEELEARAIAAGEAYCTYMVEQANYQLFQYFASGTETYRAITSAEAWPQDALKSAITGQSISNYVRYTDDLFSARVTMTMALTFEGASVQTYPLDAILFFENRRDGWMVIAMTNEDITRPTTQVRLTFMAEDTQLSTVFCDAESTELYAPQITAPQGQVFAGWAEKTVAPDGSTRMNLVFTTDESGKLNIPQGSVLEPMTLYALYEESEVNE